MSFPRRRESIKVFSKLDSRFHGNDKVQYIIIKQVFTLVFNENPVSLINETTLEILS